MVDTAQGLSAEEFHNQGLGPNNLFSGPSHCVYAKPYEALCTNFKGAYLGTTSLTGQQSVSAEVLPKLTEDFAPSLEAPIFAISRSYPWYPIGLEPNTRTCRKSYRDFGICD